MRFLPAIFVATSLVLLPALADAGTDKPDPNEKFYDMFTLGVYKDGRLDVYILDYPETWVNGVVQSEVDSEYKSLLKPGDVVEAFAGGSVQHFLRDRLDRLTPARADFSRWIYAAIKTRNAGGLWEYRPGAPQLTDTFTLDLTQPNGLLIDEGLNYVVSGCGKTPRSK